MCGGFPCNCCKPRLSIDTDFDNDLPWKCFFRNRSESGTYALAGNRYERTDASVRPILDWPCVDSQLQIPVWTGANNDRFRELLLDMKHPFDAEGGDSLEAIYSFIVETEMPSGRRFNTIQIAMDEVLEGPDSWYGATPSSTTKALPNIGTTINANGDLFVGTIGSNPNTFFSVNPAVWSIVPTTGVADGNITGANTFEFTVQRTNTQYIFQLEINGVLQTFGASGQTDTTSPFCDLITPPRTPNWAIPKPWKNYRFRTSSNTVPDVAPPRSAIPDTPIYYDRIAISSSL